ncbi:MAG: DNA mismatch repair endonuclease MutL [Holosporales bacterium]|jgi:DNA mismatch repair protein MutL|nr:DNA mismatch repair endonuclease MutL [Holosporales bacterium]
MGRIQLLSDEIVNQIAAGEIVERPFSALKELVENSLDAEAKNIDIFLKNGGKSKIVVNDDGIGMEKDDLMIAIKRHATSKLNGSNLFDIRSYGFRGEALPSIASVSNFSIESNGFGVGVNFSEETDVFPSPVLNGTRVTAENLFSRIPARLKFLKSDSAELNDCVSVIENIAITSESVNFVLRTDEKTVISFKNDSVTSRIASIFGKEIFERAIYFAENEKNLSVSGYLFHPMDTRYSRNFQRVFVNKRIVNDKIVSASIRNAYKELIPSGRFAIAVVFIEIDPFHVDSNVSPTKSEVRFRDGAYIQKFLTNSVKKHLSKFDRVAVDFDFSRVVPFTKIKTSTIASSKASAPVLPITNRGYSLPHEDDEVVFSNGAARVAQSAPLATYASPGVSPEIPDCNPLYAPSIEDDNENFFGEPIAQIFDTYIIAKTSDALIIIDQHAVHEKIVQEKIVRNLNRSNKQYITKPELMELTTTQLAVARAIINHIGECGFHVEIVQKALLISAIPTVLDSDEAIRFLNDVLEAHDNIENIDIVSFMKRGIASIACHNSIRAGRKLSFGEMSELLKQMAKTKTIHQCNHHRLSFIKITKKQLNKMFDR